MSIPVRVIAGQHSGIPVTIDANLYPLFESMATLAKGGSHWASLAVRQLSALSSGHFKKNVYIQCNGRLDEFGEYTVILPGCKASFRKNASGAFYIYALEADVEYASKQQDLHKPGLFNVVSGRGGWQPSFIATGKIEKRGINLVAISDRMIRLDHAVELAADSIANAGLRAGDIELNGFDLHFTPGRKSIGGMRNLQQAYGAETDSELHESAILLAKTMASSRSIEGITWISERGGSGVLTQAMRMLKEGGVNFKETKHRAFFSDVQTNIGRAEQLAREIGLKFDGKSHVKSLFNINQLLGSGLFGGFVNPIKRRILRENQYSTLKCLSDMGTEFKQHKSAYGSVIAAPAAVKAFYASSAGLGAAFAAGSGVVIMITSVGAAAVGSYAMYKGISALGKSYLPMAFKKK